MENVNFWLQTVISILSGIAVLIPLIIKLVNYIKEATKEKNWNNVLKLMMNLMGEAETKFDVGADRKEWVLAEMRAVADTLNYNIDWVVLADMIDAICDASKKINPKEVIAE